MQKVSAQVSHCTPQVFVRVSFIRQRPPSETVNTENKLFLKAVATLLAELQAAFQRNGIADPASCSATHGPTSGQRQREHRQVAVFLCLQHVSSHIVVLLAVAILLWLVIDKAKHLLYHSCKLFSRHTVNHMFFRSYGVIGMENLPERGLVMLTGSHNNQFVDEWFCLGTVTGFPLCGRFFRFEALKQFFYVAQN